MASRISDICSGLRGTVASLMGCLAPLDGSALPAGNLLGDADVRLEPSEIAVFPFFRQVYEVVDTRFKQTNQLLGRLGMVEVAGVFPGCEPAGRHPVAVGEGAVGVAGR